MFQSSFSFTVVSHFRQMGSVRVRRTENVSALSKDFLLHLLLVSASGVGMRAPDAADVAGWIG